MGIWIGRRLAALVRHPRTHKIAIWCVAIVVTIGAIVSVAPPLLRNKTTAALFDKIHRQVSIEEIWVDPLTMTAFADEEPGLIGN